MIFKLLGKLVTFIREESKVTRALGVSVSQNFFIRRTLGSQSNTIPLKKEVLWNKKSGVVCLTSYSNVLLKPNSEINLFFWLIPKLSHIVSSLSFSSFTNTFFFECTCVACCSVILWRCYTDNSQKHVSNLVVEVKYVFKSLGKLVGENSRIWNKK